MKMVIDVEIDIDIDNDIDMDKEIDIDNIKSDTSTMNSVEACFIYFPK